MAKRYLAKTGYLLKDLARAKAMGLRVSHDWQSTRRSAFYPKEKRITLGPRLHRAAKLASLRHEIGHAEVYRNTRDRQRLRRAAQQGMTKADLWYPTATTAANRAAKRIAQGSLARSARGYRSELLAWKNAIRQSPHGNIGRKAWKLFDTYKDYAPDALVYSPPGPPTKMHKKAVATLKRYQRMIRRPGFRAQFNKGKK